MRIIWKHVSVKRIMSFTLGRSVTAWQVRLEHVSNQGFVFRISLSGYECAYILDLDNPFRNPLSNIHNALFVLLQVL